MTLELVRCRYCRGLVAPEDAFCACCGGRTRRPPRPRDRASVEVTVFSCPGCGASMRFSPEAAALACPFCDTRKLGAEVHASALVPSRVVPFAEDRDRAAARLGTWLSSRWFRPSDLAARASVRELRGVHLPCWVFCARVEARWTADSSRTPAGARASWCPTSGRHRAEVEDLLVEASASLSPGELEALCPFDLDRARSPTTEDPHAEVVEQFALGRRYARTEARRLLVERMRAACAAEVPGSHRSLRVALRVSRMESEPVLLPVWVAAYRYRDRVFRLLVNGQTGAVTGEAPWSRAKLALAALALLALAAVLVGWYAGRC